MIRKVVVMASASGNGKTTLGRELALHSHVRRRRAWPHTLEDYPVVRLRAPAEVESFTERAARHTLRGG